MATRQKRLTSTVSDLPMRLITWGRLWRRQVKDKCLIVYTYYMHCIELNWMCVCACVCVCVTAYRRCVCLCYPTRDNLLIVHDTQPKHSWVNTTELQYAVIRWAAHTFTPIHSDISVKCHCLPTPDMQINKCVTHWLINGVGLLAVHKSAVFRQEPQINLSIMRVALILSH